MNSNSYLRNISPRTQHASYNMSSSTPGLNSTGQTNSKLKSSYSSNNGGSSQNSNNLMAAHTSHTAIGRK